MRDAAIGRASGYDARLWGTPMGYCEDLAFAACALWAGELTSKQVLARLDERQREDDAPSLARLMFRTGDIDENTWQRIQSLVQLVKQRREDSIYVRAVLRNKLASPGQINEALEIQQSLHFTSRIGQILLELGYLGKDQDPRVCSAQRSKLAREDKVIERKAADLLERPRVHQGVRQRLLERLLSPFRAWLESFGKAELEGFMEARRRREESHRFRRPTRDLIGARSREETLEIPGYQRLAFLGEGAMGNVYKYLQLSLQRYVAIKFLTLDGDIDQAMFMRFKREAQLAAALNHPNIVQAYDVGSAEDVPYIIMELVDGSSLNRIVDSEGPLPEVLCLDIAAQAVSALDHARAQGIIHRDIKPANLMLTRKGQLKICDFGLAKRSVEEVRLTSTGTTMGTPHYMSPEQCANGSNVDARSDIYSLGASLYRLATGYVPFDGDAAVTIMFMHCSDAFPDPRERFPELGLSDSFVALIKKMMEKDPSDRWSDFAELYDLIEELRQKRETEVDVPDSRAG